jgi:hypothetical protein
MSLIYEFIQRATEDQGTIEINVRDGFTFVWLPGMFQPVILYPNQRATMKYEVRATVDCPVKFRCDVFRK